MLSLAHATAGVAAASSFGAEAAWSHDGASADRKLRPGQNPGSAQPSASDLTARRSRSVVWQHELSLHGSRRSHACTSNARFVRPSSLSLEAPPWPHRQSP